MPVYSWQNVCKPHAYTCLLMLAGVQVLAKISKSKNIMATSAEFVDIAGLVKGASKGEGLGNQFLANIRECDALVQATAPFICLRALCRGAV